MKTLRILRGLNPPCTVKTSLEPSLELSLFTRERDCVLLNESIQGLCEAVLFFCSQKPKVKTLNQNPPCTVKPERILRRREYSVHGENAKNPPCTMKTQRILRGRP
jgi:hypothetical protein